MFIYINIKKIAKYRFFDRFFDLGCIFFNEKSSDKSLLTIALLKINDLCIFEFIYFRQNSAWKITDDNDTFYRHSII